MHILRIVSQVRRHFRRRDPHTPVRRHRQQEQEQPPDLRRWSDFENPFPSVSPGGYRRYYETHGGMKRAPTSTKIIMSAHTLVRQLALEPVQHSVDTPNPQNQTPASGSSPIVLHMSIPAPATSFSPSSSPQPSPQSSPLPFDYKGYSPQRLSTIPERKSSPKPSARRLTQLSRHPPSLSTPKTKTPFLLRHKKRRLLRTPSVIKDFSDWVPTSTVVSTVDLLDGDGYVYLSSESSESHGDETPPTSVDGHNLKEEEAFLQEVKDLDGRPQKIERPESRSSFHSARSHLSGENE